MIPLTEVMLGTPQNLSTDLPRGPTWGQYKEWSQGMGLLFTVSKLSSYWLMGNH